MAEIKGVREQWQDLRKAILPKNVTQFQLDEMEKAFVGGYSACLFTMKQVSEQIEDEDEAAAMLERHFQECQQFVKAWNSEN